MTNLHKRVSLHIAHRRLLVCSGHVTIESGHEIDRLLGMIVLRLGYPSYPADYRHARIWVSCTASPVATTFLALL
jgi:hypothetical protein